LVETLTDTLKLSGEINMMDGDTIDHILPISFGFNWKIPPNIMADKRNIRLIDRSSNSSKGYKCTEIPKFIQKYMINVHERTMKEKTMEGIRIAKEKGLYTGRKRGSKESDSDFLNKPKIKEVIKYLNMGWKSIDICKEVDIHINTITKIKKLIKEKN
jgi:DNA invertase Pin-like site-specific DNA recombinase